MLAISLQRFFWYQPSSRNESRLGVLPWNQSPVYWLSRRNTMFSLPLLPQSDAPYYFPGTSTPVYNWDKRYYGWITISYAIRNPVTYQPVKSLEAVQLDNSLQFLNGLGIITLKCILMRFQVIQANRVTNTEQVAKKWRRLRCPFANGGT